MAISLKLGLYSSMQLCCSLVRHSGHLARVCNNCTQGEVRLCNESAVLTVSWQCFTVPWRLLLPSTVLTVPCAVCVLHRRHGISAGLASSAASSRTATRTMSCAVCLHFEFVVACSHRSDCWQCSGGSAIGYNQGQADQRHMAGAGSTGSSAGSGGRNCSVAAGHGRAPILCCAHDALTTSLTFRARHRRTFALLMISTQKHTN